MAWLTEHDRKTANWSKMIPQSYPLWVVYIQYCPVDDDDVSGPAELAYHPEVRLVIGWLEAPSGGRMWPVAIDLDGPVPRMLDWGIDRRTGEGQRVFTFVNHSDAVEFAEKVCDETLDDILGRPRTCSG